MEPTMIVSDEDIEKEKVVTLISPKHPFPHKMFLSNIDQAVSFPVETLFFFQVEKEKKLLTCDINERIKKAICELLIPYYFMAGRLYFNSENKRLEILCNNAGVLFVGAKSKLELVDLGNLSLPNASFGHFIHRQALYKGLDETSLLTIQVTRFKCGGFAVGFLTNHVTLDGKAASHMFLNLASICKDGTLKIPSLYLDRTFIKARNPPIVTFPHQEYIMLPKISSIPTTFTTSFESSPSPLIFKKKYSQKLFNFNKKMINTLKSKTPTKCSTFEVLVAHIWKQRTKVMFNDLEQVSTVLFAVDIRSKISPPLQDGFVGNAVITAFASSKVMDLIENDVSYGVELIKNGKERVTQEYVRSVIDWLEIYKGIPATQNGNFYVSAWCKLPFGDLDFGFGVPQHVSPIVAGNDEFVLLLSEANSRGQMGEANSREQIGEANSRGQMGEANSREQIGEANSRGQMGEANSRRQMGDEPCKEHGGVNAWITLEPEKMDRFENYIFDF
ncbi:acyltransferase GLAUCE-like [Amaranthus tricolor]|uniref:acyltransferase GLAUCE-like n=1 Tax=Amaranthus tricolor TaxID=29722 RepID=UPI00258BDAC6|nr:acyltransferase GLAUCE-like [Amaranthus tricolor]